MLVVGGAAAGGYVLWNRFSGSGGDPSAAPTQPGDVRTVPRGLAFGPDGGSGTPGMGNGMGEGSNPKATTVVELYEDFFCPHCQALEAEAGDFLRAQAESGRIRIVRYPLTFVAGEQSKRAGLAYACAADQDTSGKGELASKAAKQLFDSIAAKQANAVEDAAMQELSKQTPNPDEFMSCLQNQDYSAWVGSVGDAASARQVSATPTVFVNGKPVTATEGGWQQAIQAAIQ